MDANRYMIYGEAWEFEDIILCAFRYAITRHTYILLSTLDWIKQNSHLISERGWCVMKCDLENTLDDYESKEDGIKNYEMIDYDTLIQFRNWLLDFGKGQEWYGKRNN